MKKREKNTTRNSFLKQDVQEDLTKHHHRYLGTDIPKDYFANAKHSILEKIKEVEQADFDVKKEQPKKQMVFYMRSSFKYVAAASITLLISLAIWFQTSNEKQEFKNVNIETYAAENAILIESLLIEEERLDDFTEAALFSEVMVKAELKEQELDNLFLDVLILEDTLLEDYMNKELIETVVL